eukprot:g9098.t1
MAGAIGLSGIHNVTGICDLCGVKCDRNKEDLNALDCTYKDCPSMVYHQDCLEKYLKSIRLEKNRKTGFKCPRGCGKGTRFPEACRGKVDKSHPIHVRHEQSTKAKLERKSSQKDTETRTKKEPPSLKPTPNLADLNLTKELPSKHKEQNSEWRVSLTRSKSMDKTQKHRRTASTGHSSVTLMKNRSKLANQSSCLTPSKTDNNNTIQSKTQQTDVASKSSNESVRSHLEECSDNSSQHPSILSCESPDPVPMSIHQSGAGSHERNLDKTQERTLLEKCKRCLMEWKSTMLIKQLYRMGFEMWRANSAVQIFGTQIENAIQWLLQNTGLTHDQMTVILCHHPTAKIDIDFEMQMIIYIARKYSIEDTVLQKTVVKFEGDLKSAVQSLLGSKADECCFPDFDLSLGIVQSESPFIHKRSFSQEIEVVGGGGGGVHSESSSSDELLLRCVLGNALEDYKRGNADFTDLVHKDLSFYDHMQFSGGINSSLPSPMNQLSYYNVQNEPPVYGVHGLNQGVPNETLSSGFSTLNYQYFGLDPRGGDPAMQSVMPNEVRHFIGDILE